MSVRFLAFIGILVSISFNMAGVGMYNELITLTDGSEICGYVAKDNLSNGEIEVLADWSITCVPSKDIIVNRENGRDYRLDAATKEWFHDYYGECPNEICFANITMDGEDCNPDYLLYDQMLSSDSQSFDKILLEDGDIIKYVDFTPRKFTLNWSNVARIDRNVPDTDMGFIETIVPYEGEAVDGIIESQILRHHRVLKTRTGKKITFFPKNIKSILKKTPSSDISLFKTSPIIDCLELEENVGIEKMEGIIIENDRENKYFILLTNSEDKDAPDNLITKKVRYADIKSISYRRNN